MTGYASVQRDLAAFSLSLEPRSVNARFLDLTFKIPDEMRALELPLRERLSGTLQRGKLECRLSYQRRAGADRRPRLDRALLAQLALIADEVRTIVPGASPLTVAELLRWPGVMGEDRFEPQAMGAEVLSMADAALQDFVASRAREGEQLARVIGERIDAIERIVASVTQTAPGLLTCFEDRLTERLKSVLVQSSEGSAVPVEETFARVRQEITAYGLRIDVAEELSRLSAHAVEVRRVLRNGGPVGKRLDFLMQELNREANTLGSKAAALEFSASAMELKLLIEQIREQVQNLE